MLTFLFVLLLDDVDDAAALGSETRGAFVEVLIKDGLELFRRGTEERWKERSKE